MSTGYREGSQEREHQAPTSPGPAHYWLMVGISGWLGGVEGRTTHLPVIGSPVIMELCYGLWDRQVAPKHVIQMTQLMPESGPSLCKEILFPFWSKWADGQSLCESQSLGPQVTVQMEKNEIPCRRLSSPQTVGSDPCPGHTCRNARIPRGRLIPVPEGTQRPGMIMGTARTLATFQSRNDQKPGTKCNMEGIRTKAVK